MKKTVIIGIIFMAFTWGITSKADNLDSETQNSTEYHTSTDTINSQSTEKLQTSDSINESNNLEDFSFSEKHINIKANINDFLRSGELFQDQANIFLSRLDQATTIDELNVLWSDIKKQIADNKMALSSSASTEKNSSSNSNQNSEDSASVDNGASTNTSSKKTAQYNTIPKTGEQQNILWTIAGTTILVFLGLFYWYKKSKRKMSDKTQ